MEPGWQSGRVARSTLIALPLLLVFVAVSFALSHVLLSAYVHGDQFVYRLFYDSLARTALGDVLEFQAVFVSGLEPIYGLVMWAGAQIGVDKDVWISGFNAAFALLVLLWLRSGQAHWALYPLIFSNYYFVVLLTSAERLKFAFLALLLVALTRGWVRALFLGVAPLCHFQTLILYVALAAGRLRRIRTSRHVRARTLLGLGGLVGAGLLLAAAFGDDVTDKAATYLASNDTTISDVLPVIVIVLVGVAVLRGQIEFLLAIVPLLAATAALGPERLNMISVTVLVAFAVKERRGHHPLLLLLLAYFSIKSIGYVSDVLTTGSGYSISSTEIARRDALRWVAENALR